MVSLIFGVLAVILGILGMHLWTVDLVHFLKGMVPMALSLAGIIAIIAGVSSRAPKRSREKTP